MSVYGTGTIFCSTRGFSWKHGITDFTSSEETRRHHISALMKRPLVSYLTAYLLEPHIHQVAELPFSVPPCFNAHIRWYRNINLLSIAYAFRPRLRTRLTLGGLTFPRKPWVYGETCFSPVFIATHVGILTRRTSTVLSVYLHWRYDAPLPLLKRRISITRSFGIMLEPRYIFGADSLDQ